MNLCQTCKCMNPQNTLKKQYLLERKDSMYFFSVLQYTQRSSKSTEEHFYVSSLARLSFRRPLFYYFSDACAILLYFIFIIILPLYFFQSRAYLSVLRAVLCAIYALCLIYRLFLAFAARSTPRANSL